GTSMTRMGIDRDAWWKEAAVIWGKAKRDKLLLRLIEVSRGLTKLYLTNGKTIPFEEVQRMSWEMIEAIAIE
ncbi:hypothetical protein NL462_26890, partial [Klebsiella pneumoniae]|nr:hypothetical protein [Klebsiella pneumoniae]